MFVGVMLVIGLQMHVIVPEDLFVGSVGPAGPDGLIPDSADDLGSIHAVGVGDIVLRLNLL